LSLRLCEKTNPRGVPSRVTRLETNGVRLARPAPPREVKRMHEPILVINAGSSSIKFSVFKTGADRSLSPTAHGSSRECRDLPDDRRPPARGGQKMICPAAQRLPGSSSQWTPSWSGFELLVPRRGLSLKNGLAITATVIGQDESNKGVPQKPLSL
jgi:hypothetical protein